MAKRGVVAPQSESKGPPARLRPGARYDDATFIRLVYFFCNGLPVRLTAKLTGLTPKTVRGVYLELRARLLEPQFNRWHATNGRLVDLPEVGGEAIIRAGFFFVLAQCANNETCARNWRLGNRKKRQCRSCPLADVYRDNDRAAAHTVIDTVHQFYERIGIRGEKEGNSVLLFRERLVHMTVVATARANSVIMANGLASPKDRGFLSASTLVSALAFGGPQQACGGRES